MCLVRKFFSRFASCILVFSSIMECLTEFLWSQFSFKNGSGGLLQIIKNTFVKTKIRNRLWRNYTARKMMWTQLVFAEVCHKIINSLTFMEDVSGCPMYQTPPFPPTCLMVEERFSKNLTIPDKLYIGAIQGCCRFRFSIPINF